MPILPRNQSNSANGSWPWTDTRPDDGCSNPEMRLNVVDLPQPVLPRIATSSPRPMREAQIADRVERRAAIGARKRLVDALEDDFLLPAQNERSATAR